MVYMARLSVTAVSSRKNAPDTLRSLVSAGIEGVPDTLRGRPLLGGLLTVIANGGGSRAACSSPAADGGAGSTSSIDPRDDLGPRLVVRSSGSFLFETMRSSPVDGPNVDALRPNDGLIFFFVVLSSWRRVSLGLMGGGPTGW